MEAGIIGVVVLIIIAIAVAAFALGRRKEQESKDSQTASLNGQTISATVLEIDEKTILVNPTITEFAKRYFIKAEWLNTETQRTYLFTSAPLAEVPEHIQVGGPVKVRLDPEDPYEYIVVLSP